MRTNKRSVSVGREACEPHDDPADKRPDLAVVPSHARRAQGHARPADDGTAHTMAEWMLLEHGRIASVGTGVPPEAGAAHTIDLGGRLVLPGLIDVQQCVESAASGGAPSLAGHPG